MVKGSQFPINAGVGWYYNIRNGHSDMGPEERYQKFAGEEHVAAGPTGSGRTSTDREDGVDDRDHPGGGSGVYRSAPEPEGLILGRLYRMIFGGPPAVRDHDAEVQQAAARVSQALENLDRDVLTLMSATLTSSVAGDDDDDFLIH